MRRRQEWAKNPPPFVATEIKPINEAQPPEETPRRRSIYVQPEEIALHWDKTKLIEKAMHPGAPIIEAPIQEERKRPGRPRKDKQAP